MPTDNHAHSRSHRNDRRPPNGRVDFGDFSLDPDTPVLYRRGEVVRLRPMAAKALVFLVANRDRVVCRDELYEELWGPLHVETGIGLNAIIRQLRAALGDDSGRPAYIETYTKVGYRFIAPTGAACQPTPTAWWQRRATVATAGLLLSIAVLASFAWPGRDTHPDVAASSLAAPAYEQYLLGRTAFDEGRFRDSSEHFAAVTEAAPGFAAGRAWLGHSLLSAWNVDEAVHDRAEQHFRRAIESDPDSADALAGLAIVALYRDLDVAAANTLAERALRLDAGSTFAALVSVEIKLLMSRTDEAKRLLERLEQTDPVALARRSRLGWAWFNTGDYASAAKHCRANLALTPDPYLARLCLFESYLALEEHTLARAQAAEIMTLLGAAEVDIGAVSGPDAASGVTAFLDWYLAYLAERRPKQPFLAYPMALTSLYLGQVGNGVELLHEVFERRMSPFVAYIAIDPNIQALRGVEEAEAFFAVYDAALAL